MSTTIVILAAGRSTRMHSDLPKVLHQIAKRPALGYVLETACRISPSRIILVTAPNMQNVREFANQQYQNIVHVIQDKPLGTGDAVKCALSSIENNGNTIILYGDVPFVSVETLNKLNKNNADICLAAFYAKDPKHYGRVITFNNDLISIVEYNEANDEERLVNYCNSGILAVKNKYLHQLIPLIKNINNKGEYYLTDLVKLGVEKELICATIDTEENEVLAFNTREESSILEEIAQSKIKSRLMNEGVTIILPATSYIAYDFKAGKDVTIYPNVYIGENVATEDNVTIHSFSHIEGAVIKAQASIGPFARIRPSTTIDEKTKIGNFVEIKNSYIDENTKINHLSYIGDTKIGKNTNIGAGTITCNFDGIATKSKTYIGNNVSIGSNSSLIAPITIKDGAFIAAGSVVTKDANENDLVFARAIQKNITGGAKKIKKK